MRRIRKKRRVRRLHAVLTALVLAIPVGLSSLALTGHTATGYPAGPPAKYNPAVPQMPRDTGAGEPLLLVVGGTYETKAEAEAASVAYSFGQLQGYYVVPVGAFQGFKEGAGSPGDWALVSAFRTRVGAEEFTSLAASVGIPARIVGPVVSQGSVYAGLGQEEDPDGHGPLTHPLSPGQQAALR